MKTEPKTPDEKILDDESIVELYWQRNEDAIKETDKKYNHYLLTIANNIVHDRMDSEECLNDTYIGTWNKIPPSRPTLLQVFLARIMRNCALDMYRKKTAERRVPSELVSSYEELEDCVAINASVEEEYAVRELGKHINAYIRTLDTREEFVFFCRYYYADTIEDIAARLSLSRSTVVRTLAKIRKGLKAYLEQEGFLYE